MNWKDILGKLVESLACVDPIAYTYYLAAKTEASQLQPTIEDEADESELVRLIDRLQSRSQASA